MEELINLQEWDNNKLTHYLKVFNNLTDEEIVSFFDNEKGNSKIKNKLIEIAKNRISQLPTPIFIEISTWAETPETYLNNYLERIEKMTYEEFVDFLYNGVYAEKIMLLLTESKIYKKYLEEEKTKELGTSIQIIALEKELYLVDNNVKKLDTIGTEIIKLINKRKKQEQIYSLVCFYLDKMIKNMDSLQISSTSIESALEILKIQMKSHKILSPKMLEFYLLFRIKELNLRTICKDVIVTLGNTNGLAYYTLCGDIGKEGTLKINYEKLMNKFKEYKEKNREIKREELNDTINMSILPLLSHELRHIIDMKEYLENTSGKEKSNFQNEIITNKIVNRKMRNMHLKIILGEESYSQEYHDLFIDEARADIFSCFDTNKQLLTNFKNCYNSIDIVGRVTSFAELLVKKYTSENGNFISPMEQFNIFYTENIKKTDRIPIVGEEETDIFNALLNGETIPIELYEFLKQIASGKIITMDLETTIKKFIVEYEQKLETTGPSL